METKESSKTEERLGSALKVALFLAAAAFAGWLDWAKPLLPVIAVVAGAVLAAAMIGLMVVVARAVVRHLERH